MPGDVLAEKHLPLKPAGHANPTRSLIGCCMIHYMVFLSASPEKSSTEDRSAENTPQRLLHLT